MTTLNRRKNPLFNCSNRKYLIEYLTRKSSFSIEKKDLRAIGILLDKKDKVFFESKKLKIRTSTEPKKYSESKYRKFYSPSPERKFYLKRINKSLQLIPVPSYLMSVSKKDYIKNALVHRGNSRYIMLDLSNFFPKCTYKQVRDFFISDNGLRMTIDLATILTEFVTIYDTRKTRRIVPQGFPTSTLIAFFSYKNMFDEINNLAKANNLRFTTYVDDLTFSFNEDNNIDAEEFCVKAKSIVNKYGHDINLNKKNIFYSDNMAMNYKLPIITGIYLKRWKIRASPKMHSNLIKTYNKIKKLEIHNIEDYFNFWKLYLRLNGQLLTIDLIEPSITHIDREEIRNYLKRNKNNIPFETNIKKIIKLNMQSQVYNAYKNDELRSLIIENSNILFK